jgi:putative transcriptional regulator
MIEIAPGLVLIADPFLKDPHFKRTVIVICEHQPQGSFGFVLNKLYDQRLGELVSDIEYSDFPVYYGGPVQQDTIHFLHKRPDIIPDGSEIMQGIFWGGDFSVVVELIKTYQLQTKDIRFFLGYSGWGEGQLKEEMGIKSWITSIISPEMIFRENAEQTWQDALKDLGGEYELMTNYPIDPQLN